MKKALIIFLVAFLTIFMLGCTATGFFIFGYLAKESSNQSLSKPQTSSEKLTEIVNNWRISQNFQPFKEDYFLCSLANQRSIEIQSDWSHDGFWKYTKHVRYNDFGENLIKGYLDPTEAFNAWLNSPEHKENLVKPYQYACIRCTETYCAQEFANF